MLSRRRELGVAVVVAMAGCSSDADTSSPVHVVLSGAVEKGPFVLGSSIHVVPLSATLDPTGELFSTQTIDDAGRFSIEFDAAGDQTVSIEGTGFYYNELTGTLSSAPITLRALDVASASGAHDAYLNLITHLAYQRARTLVEGGASVGDAEAAAEAELRAELHIGPTGFDPGVRGLEMSILGGDSDANAYLLAVGAVLLQAAADRGGPIDAALQETLNELSVDLADDGAFTVAHVDLLLAAQQALDPDLVMMQLAARLSSIGSSAVVPDINRIIDTDLDGVVNSSDNCRLDANADQADVDGDGLGDVCDEPAISCDGLADTCGATGTDDCCTSLPVDGGTFYRSYDSADGMFSDMSNPATVSDFRLDKYEVTVGRFRAFVEAGQGTQTSPPAPGAGEHPGIPGSGWDAAWNAMLATDTAALRSSFFDFNCFAWYRSWTDEPGDNESRPMTCITWWEAAAFCAWDNAFLPTEAEWNYAASGGDQQRAYPWSDPATSLAIDADHASYSLGTTDDCYGDGAFGCAVTDLVFVGSKPDGDGRWGQSELAGNVREWTLDYYHDAYVNPCVDCAELTPPVGSGQRVIRGGGFADGAQVVRTGARDYLEAFVDNRSGFTGVRCARRH